jgi:peptide/nickel transport system substrate-binding protein
MPHPRHRKLPQPLSTAKPATDTANMLAYRPFKGGRVADTRPESVIFVNLETGQDVGRLGSRVARTCRSLRWGLILACFCAVASCRSSETPARPPGPSAPSRGGELAASIRSEPPTYNRFVAAGAVAATEVVTFLTQSRLVRVNRATDELEPWLAEGWTSSADGLTHTITLKPDIVFSDGVRLTSADVVFSFRAALDPAVASPLASSLTIHGKPLGVTAPDARTVVVRFPEPFAPGLRRLDSLPILPRHVLEPLLDAGEFRQAWVPSRPVSDIVGLGPFQLVEHVAGQRLVFARNPRYFRRDDSGVQLPYLDRLTLVIVPDQNTEALRLEAAESDLMTNGDIRPQDYAAFKRLADQGRLRMIDVGVALDADFLSFNLRPARLATRRVPWLARREFRQAISCGVDREAIVNTVYLGVAVPLFGPVTSGNRRWFSPGAPPCPAATGDRDRARQLLKAAGLTDRNGDGMLDDAGGAVRFSILTQAGHLRERVTAVLQEQLRQIGIAIDIVPLDPKGLQQRWIAGDYDAIYFGLQSSSTDPDPDFWLSSGPYHFWNPGQASPATAWERRIDELMREQATAASLEERQRAFAEVQRIFGEELPSIYFVASRVTLATSPRVVNPTPAPLAPHLLWSADTLAARR